MLLLKTQTCMKSVPIYIRPAVYFDCVRQAVFTIEHPWKILMKSLIIWHGSWEGNVEVCCLRLCCMSTESVCFWSGPFGENSDSESHEGEPGPRRRWAAGPSETVLKVLRDADVISSDSMPISELEASSGNCLASIKRISHAVIHSFLHQPTIISLYNQGQALILHTKKQYTPNALK